MKTTTRIALSVILGCVLAIGALACTQGAGADDEADLQRLAPDAAKDDGIGTSPSLAPDAGASK